MNTMPTPDAFNASPRDGYLDGDFMPWTSVEEKWQGAVTKGSGFVAVPMALLRLQTSFGLTATDFLVLINLLAHWWEPDTGVYPRSTTIARRMGVDKRTVQRSTSKLVKLGLMTRNFQDDGKRVFQFDPLLSKLGRELPHAYALQKKEIFDA